MSENPNTQETTENALRRISGECETLRGHLDSLRNFLRERGEADPINLPVGRAIGLIKRLEAERDEMRDAMERAYDDLSWNPADTKDDLIGYIKDAQERIAKLLARCGGA